MKNLLIDACARMCNSVYFLSYEFSMNSVNFIVDCQILMRTSFPTLIIPPIFVITLKELK
jgi:hypothetical protein